MAVLQREPLRVMLDSTGWEELSDYLREVLIQVRNKYLTTKDLQSLGLLQGQEFQINQVLQFKERFNEACKETDEDTVEM